MNEKVSNSLAYVRSHKQIVFEALLVTLLIERDRKIAITPKFMDFANTLADLLVHAVEPIGEPSPTSWR